MQTYTVNTADHSPMHTIWKEWSVSKPKWINGGSYRRPNWTWFQNLFLILMRLRVNRQSINPNWHIGLQPGSSVDSIMIIKNGICWRLISGMTELHVCKDKRWNLFPSFSAGWNVAREAFMESTGNIINTLKSVVLGESWATRIRKIYIRISS